MQLPLNELTLSVDRAYYLPPLAAPFRLRPEGPAVDLALIVSIILDLNRALDILGQIQQESINESGSEMVVWPDQPDCLACWRCVQVLVWAC